MLSLRKNGAFSWNFLPKTLLFYLAQLDEAACRCQDRTPHTKPQFLQKPSARPGSGRVTPGITTFSVPVGAQEMQPDLLNVLCAMLIVVLFFCPREKAFRHPHILNFERPPKIHLTSPDVSSY